MKAKRPNPNSVKLTAAEDKLLLKFIQFAKDDTYGCNAPDVRKKGRRMLREIKAGIPVDPKDYGFYGW